MQKINNKVEKNNYFIKTIETDGAYFQVKYPNGETEFIWVKKFENWNGPGDHWFLESPTDLIAIELTENSLAPFYDEEDDEMYMPYAHCFVMNGVAYEIDALQTEPFLPEAFSISFIANTQKEAAEFMLSRIEQF